MYEPEVEFVMNEEYRNQELVLSGYRQRGGYSDDALKLWKKEKKTLVAYSPWGFLVSSVFLAITIALSALVYPTYGITALTVVFMLVGLTTVLAVAIDAKAVRRSHELNVLEHRMNDYKLKSDTVKAIDEILASPVKMLSPSTVTAWKSDVAGIDHISTLPKSFRQLYSLWRWKHYSIEGTGKNYSDEELEAVRSAIESHARKVIGLDPVDVFRKTEVQVNSYLNDWHKGRNLFLIGKFLTDVYGETDGVRKLKRMVQSNFPVIDDTDFENSGIQSTDERKLTVLNERIQILEGLLIEKQLESEVKSDSDEEDEPVVSSVLSYEKDSGNHVGSSIGDSHGEGKLNDVKTRTLREAVLAVSAVQLALGELRTDIGWVIDNPAFFDTNSALTVDLFESLFAWEDSARVEGNDEFRIELSFQIEDLFADNKRTAEKLGLDYLTGNTKRQMEKASKLVHKAESTEYENERYNLMAAAAKILNEIATVNFPQTTIKEIEKASVKALAG